MGSTGMTVDPRDPIMTAGLVAYSVDHDARVAVVTLNRPDVRNALSTELVESAIDHVRQAALDPDVRSVIPSSLLHPNRRVATSRRT